MRRASAADRAAGWRVSLRALGGRLGEQWERERRDTLFVMAAILFAALPIAAYLPWWAVGGFGILFAWRFGLVVSGRWLPRASVRWFAMVACAAAVWAHYRTFLGRDPGVTLLFLFLGLKLMEMRARRDLHVVVILCFFVLLTTFFSSQSALTALLAGIAVLVLVTTMLTMHSGAAEIPIARRFRLAGTLIVQALPLAVVVFLLFPRMQGPLWGWSVDGRFGGTGLSETMSPGQIAHLTESDAVAFRVTFDTPSPAHEQLYWRGPAFGAFDGRTWRPVSPSVAARPLPRIDPAARATVRYTVTIEPSAWNWLFALDTPVAVDTAQGVPALLDEEMLLSSQLRLNERTRVRIESDLKLRAGRDEHGERLDRWLQLPGGYAPKARALAARWAAEEPDPWRRVLRALELFRDEEFRYTTRPPLATRDPVDQFLFETRAGFCEHYASAFTVLARAMSIPARVVTGYQGGEVNPVDGSWVVRQADAHAWSEIWIAGRGWVRVDPTASIAPQRVEAGSRAVRDDANPFAALGRPLFDGIRFNFDALSNAWNDWVLSYDSTIQFRLLSLLGLAIHDWADLAGVLAIAMAIAIGGVALVTLHPRRPRDPVERCYSEFCERLASAGIVREPHETPTALLERASAGFGEPARRQAAGIVAAYNALRYGPGDANDTKGVRHLRELVQAFRP